MLPTITRKFEFDAGHRVLGHKGKCRHLHGHRYVAEVTISHPQLNELGMVLDFADVKEKIGGWIDNYWDHNLILNQKDPLNQFHKAMWSTLDTGVDGFRKEIFGGRDPYIMSQGANPTAENMAAELFRACKRLLEDEESDLKVVHVRLYETPNCWADYSAPSPFNFDYAGLEKRIIEQLEQPLSPSSFVDQAIRSWQDHIKYDPGKEEKKYSARAESGFGSHTPLGSAIPKATKDVEVTESMYYGLGGEEDDAPNWWNQFDSENPMTERTDLVQFFVDAFPEESIIGKFTGDEVMQALQIAQKKTGKALGYHAAKVKQKGCMAIFLDSVDEPDDEDDDDEEDAPMWWDRFNVSEPMDSVEELIQFFREAPIGEVMIVSNRKHPNLISDAQVGFRERYDGIELEIAREKGGPGQTWVTITYKDIVDEDEEPQSPEDDPRPKEYGIASHEDVLEWAKEGEHRDWLIVPIGIHTMQWYANEAGLSNRKLEIEQEVIPGFGAAAFFVWLWDRTGNRREDSVPEEFHRIKQLALEDKLVLTSPMLPK